MKNLVFALAFLVALYAFGAIVIGLKLALASAISVGLVYFSIVILYIGRKYFL